MLRGNNESDPRVSRRRYLEVLGITGAVGLAGCSNDGEEPVDHDDNNAGNGGNGSDPDGDEEQVLNYMRGGELFGDLQWNQFGDQHNSSVKVFVDTTSATTRNADGEIDGLGFVDWDYDVDSRVLTAELRDDITFWNGDNYDAEDYRTFQELLRLQSPESSTYESIEVTGDYAVEFVTKEAHNPEILFRSNLTDNFFDWGADVWGEWLEQYQDAPDQDARDKVTEELINWEITTERLVDEGLGTGAYIIDDVTDEYMDFVAHEGHPAHAGEGAEWAPPSAETGAPNVDKIRMWYADETGRRDQFIVNERIDYTGHGHAWKNYKDQLPDYWEQILYSPRINSYKMLINWRNREYLQDVNFRRAMAAAMDYENNGINADQLPVKSHTGMSEGHNEQYWGEPQPSEMIDYGVNADPELADEYLERGGYTREDGTIYDSDGEELEDMRFVIGGSVWADVGQSAAQQLQQFGFPVDIRPIGRTAKLETIQEDMTEWDLSTETHYAGITGHPHEFYRPGTFWGQRLGPGGFGPEPETFAQIEGWLADGETHSPFNGKPLVFDVPADVGAEDLSGDTKEINVYELVNEIQGPVDEERDREIIRDLSWAWNYMLPDIDCTVATANSFGNTQKLEFASNDELASYVGTYWAQLGLVKFK